MSKKLRNPSGDKHFVNEQREHLSDNLRSFQMPVKVKVSLDWSFWPLKDVVTQLKMTVVGHQSVFLRKAGNTVFHEI